MKSRDADVDILGGQEGEGVVGASVGLGVRGSASA